MKNSKFSLVLRWGAGTVRAVALLSVLHTIASCGGEDSDDPGEEGAADDGDGGADGSVDPKFIGTWVVSEGTLEQACSASEPSSVDTAGTKFTLKAEDGKLVLVDQDCDVELAIAGTVATSSGTQTCEKPLGGGGMVLITYNALRVETKDGSTATLTSSATAKSESPAAFECELSTTATLQKEASP